MRDFKYFYAQVNKSKMFVAYKQMSSHQNYIITHGVDTCLDDCIDYPVKVLVTLAMSTTTATSV